MRRLSQTNSSRRDAGTLRERMTLTKTRGHIVEHCSNGSPLPFGSEPRIDWNCSRPTLMSPGVVFSKPSPFYCSAEVCLMRGTRDSINFKRDSISPEPQTMFLRADSTLPTPNSISRKVKTVSPRVKTIPLGVKSHSPRPKTSSRTVKIISPRSKTFSPRSKTNSSSAVNNGKLW